MNWFLLFFMFVIVFLLVTILKKKQSFQFGPVPNTLLLKSIEGLEQISSDLKYLKHVEERVRRENKLKENEYEWRLLDLKRYFILTAILKKAPMFSEKVDEL